MRKISSGRTLNCMNFLVEWKVQGSFSISLISTPFMVGKQKRPLEACLQRALNTQNSGNSFQSSVSIKLLGAVPTGIEIAVRRFTNDELNFEPF